MTYARIENGEVVEFKSTIPNQCCCCNLSGLHNLSIAELNNHGWYEVEEIGATPEDYQTFTKSYALDQDNKIKPVYTYTDIDLEVYKTKRKNAIKTSYETELTQGLTVTAGFKIDCDNRDNNNFSTNYNYIKLKGLTSTTVRDYDNLTHTLTLAEYETMCLELGDHVTTLYGKKWTLQKQIDDATTLQEVKAVVW